LATRLAAENISAGEAFEIIRKIKFPKIDSRYHWKKLRFYMYMIFRIIDCVPILTKHGYLTKGSGIMSLVNKYKKIAARNFPSRNKTILKLCGSIQYNEQARVHCPSEFEGKDPKKFKFDPRLHKENLAKLICDPANDAMFTYKSLFGSILFLQEEQKKARLKNKDIDENLLIFFERIDYDHINTVLRLIR
jgi:hypothetical protein